MFRRVRHRVTGLFCPSKTAVQPQAREGTVRDWSGEDGITLIELILALGILTAVVYVIMPVFLQVINVSGYTSDAMVNQQRMMVVASVLTDDILEADPVIPDPDDPDGAFDRLDFAVSEVVAEGGAFVYLRSYYRYSLSGKSIEKRPVAYDEETRLVIDSGEDPVWSYEGEISSLSFQCELSPADGTVIMVTATITAGEGRGAYTKTIKVSPRNAV